MKLGQSIKQKRRAARMTQIELADRAGVGRSHLQDIESGRRTSITLYTLAKLAAATDCTPADLLTNVEIGQGAQ